MKITNLVKIEKIATVSLLSICLTGVAIAGFSDTSVAQQKSRYSKAIEGVLKTKLQQQLGVPVKSVNCQNLPKPEAGKIVNCNVLTTPGNFGVQVTLTNANGGMKYASRGLLVVPDLERFIQSSIKEKTGIQANAECGDKIRVFRQVGETFNCQVTTAKGKKTQAVVTIAGMDGKFRYVVNKLN
ncbi:DUF4333 domain-containing protein [Calothrix sp. 336/3]|uniref:DUF4333 domain-containing protein n=1 Tax=Calothrix sp. 336/3 TaxID=1337936 RepID=UPI0004E3365F|nr:DUF4333 domain-containing protein [Calothrix sp. 336/3]AKG22331.1 hypothetical protein IJ00_14605 [Calothrix sp. 336/3]